ncbi:hypothetical protein L6452_32206 [Arctium lappa]|uniref:Uncharacterized protein n=1 Tax=Arctium lappa TaxID=4217 RepID=A0ACB8Z3X2_ARCLA|nr:hypothetical protein L6452_32206 [Arctium lappa]
MIEEDSEDSNVVIVAENDRSPEMMTLHGNPLGGGVVRTGDQSNMKSLNTMEADLGYRRLIVRVKDQSFKAEFGTLASTHKVRMMEESEFGSKSERVIRQFCRNDLLFASHPIPSWELEFKDISTKRRETPSSALAFFAYPKKNPSFFL